MKFDQYRKKYISMLEQTGPSRSTTKFAILILNKMYEICEN